MKRTLLIAALLAVAPAATAEDGTGTPDRSGSPAEIKPDPEAQAADEALRAHQAQRNAALENLRTVTRLAIEGLESQIARAQTPAALKALQTRIMELKRDERLESLGIQRRYALAIDNQEMVAEIDAAVEQMLNPQAEKRSAPAVRPVPSRDGEDRR